MLLIIMSASLSLIGMQNNDVTKELSTCLAENKLEDFKKKFKSIDVAKINDELSGLRQVQQFCWVQLNVTYNGYKTNWNRRLEIENKPEYSLHCELQHMLFNAYLSNKSPFFTFLVQQNIDLNLEDRLGRTILEKMLDATVNIESDLRKTRLQFLEIFFSLRNIGDEPRILENILRSGDDIYQCADKKLKGELRNRVVQLLANDLEHGNPRMMTRAIEIMLEENNSCIFDVLIKQHKEQLDKGAVQKIIDLTIKSEKSEFYPLMVNSFFPIEDKPSFPKGYSSNTEFFQSFKKLFIERAEYFKSESAQKFIKEHLTDLEKN